MYGGRWILKISPCSPSTCLPPQTNPDGKKIRERESIETCFKCVTDQEEIV